MASAASRAQARKAAILKRGSDRLAKLTSSARGEDAPAFVHAVPDLPNPSGPSLSSFIGEESAIPRPTATSRPSRSAPDPHTSPFASMGLGGAPPDPSVWSEQQQQEMLRALMGGAGAPAGSTRPSTGSAGTPREDPLMALMSSMAQGGGGFPDAPHPSASSAAGPSPDDPLMALMSSLSAGGPPGAGAGPFAPPAADRPKSRMQRLMPLVHIISVWCLVAYFVLWKEPQTFYARTSSVVLPGGVWRRWADLGSRQAIENAWSVQVEPFFWAFISLELALHSLRIYTGLDATQPPMLLALALPHLPKPLPFLIINGLKYLQMAGNILDDLAAAVVALGLFVALASFFAA
ncbi:hypothetical protein BV25DRAFT_437927 [Artomyces pyxidatus]|uniref:Uncharacterized protein n=1 Tax=Artomyces pyxidatus TaxID=48021 RepID=A0ACB8T3G5_9AGAM|nr:hypothetical protein BV25DRAFT_437927 [Artomyces pyxidatus]